jgi:topoisomerase-4 subunit B
MASGVNMSTYDSSSIVVLKGLDPVRKRPGMYTNTDDPNHVGQEIVDNSIDEAMAGFATTINVTIGSDGFITVEDDGRGMPVDMHAEQGVSGVEVILETLHGGGKFGDDNYQFSGGLHGVGASVATALSEVLIARIKRDGKIHEITYKDSKKTGPLTVIPGPRIRKDETGTIISFKPDPQFFYDEKINTKKFKRLLKDKAILCAGVIINYFDEAKDEAITYHYEDGIIGFIQEQENYSEAVGGLLFKNSRVRDDKRMIVDWACYFSAERSTLQNAYVNIIPTISGGTHVNALRSGIFDGFKEYCDLHNLIPKNSKVSADDIWKCTNFVISLKMKEPNFAGQTKERLSSRECVPFISSAVSDAFSLFLNEWPEQAKELVELVLSNMASRLKSAKKTERKKLGSKIILPGKLTDCSCDNPLDGELFVVEGDSAGGSAKQARDRVTQAVMPLRGKILNCWELDEEKIMQSEEIRNIASAIGVDPNSSDLSELRYGKICILADADSDGLHIATLFTALFVKHFRAVIEQGHLYVAMPPLYRIDIGKKVFYALDNNEKEQVLAKIKSENLRGEVNVQRFKGLGEMNPDQLKETTMEPMTRRLVKLVINDNEVTDETMDMLLAKKRSAHRKAWLEIDGDKLSLEV